MELSKQVCSLEQAKKLKELGVEQKSIFAFTEYENAYHNKSFSIVDTFVNTSGKTKQDGRINYAAFTVAELGVMLYNYNSTYLPILDSKFKTEAEYRADRLIACIPELITVEEVNARLTD